MFSCFIISCDVCILIFFTDHCWKWKNSLMDSFKPDSGKCFAFYRKLQVEHQHSVDFWTSWVVSRFYLTL